LFRHVLNTYIIQTFASISKAFSWFMTKWRLETFGHLIKVLECKTTETLGKLVCQKLRQKRSQDRYNIRTHKEAYGGIRKPERSESGGSGGLTPWKAPVSISVGDAIPLPTIELLLLFIHKKAHECNWPARSITKTRSKRGGFPGFPGVPARKA
jgi:hypothetical protein